MDTLPEPKLFESWAKFVEIHLATIKGDPLLIIVVACVFFSIGIGVAFFYYRGRWQVLAARGMPCMYASGPGPMAATCKHHGNPTFFRSGNLNVNLRRP